MESLLQKQNMQKITANSPKENYRKISKPLIPAFCDYCGLPMDRTGYHQSRHKECAKIVNAKNAKNYDRTYRKDHYGKKVEWKRVKWVRPKKTFITLQDLVNYPPEKVAFFVRENRIVSGGLKSKKSEKEVKIYGI